MRAEVTVELRRVSALQHLLSSSKYRPLASSLHHVSSRKFGGKGKKGGWGDSKGSGGGWGCGGYGAYDAAAMGRGKGYGYKGQDAAHAAPRTSPQRSVGSSDGSC